jgi:hypothetical protein
MVKIMSRVDPITYLVIAAAIGILLLFRISDAIALAATIGLLIVAVVALAMSAIFGGPKISDR